MKMRDDFPIENNGGQETMEWSFKVLKEKIAILKFYIPKKFLKIKAQTMMFSDRQKLAIHL